MTPPATTHANQQRRFKKWDLAIFLVFPLVLLGGFLRFMQLKRNSADPNLRLVAQVSDDISLELVAVAHQSEQKQACRVLSLLHEQVKSADSETDE